MNDRLAIVEEPKRKALIQVCYGIVGAMQEVHNQLGAGLPEYIYQEALTTELTANGFVVHKEEEFHPLYRGKAMKAYLKMDLVVESPIGNIIIECKALSQLTEREHYQTFGYLRGTGWPIAILVNFGASPKAQIERFYNNKGTIEVF
jgi:GxxExxY protein